MKLYFSLFFMFQFCFANDLYEEEVMPKHWHTQFFDKLCDSMYCSSEVYGKIENYNSTLDSYRKLLVEKLTNGCDPNEVDEEGKTPLMLAAFLGYAPIIEELLKREEINIDLRDNDGLNALDYAMKATHVSAIFINPAIKKNMFVYVPYLTLFSYYSSVNSQNRTPYSQCVYLLKKEGATPTLPSFKEKIEDQIKKNIETITQLLVKTDDEEDKKEMEEEIEQLQSNLKRLQKFKESSDFAKFCIQFQYETQLKDYLAIIAKQLIRIDDENIEKASKYVIEYYLKKLKSYKQGFNILKSHVDFFNEAIFKDLNEDDDDEDINYEYVYNEA